jgi:hypothetical protein
MKKHRITEVDLYGSLRAAGIFNICEVECVVVGEWNYTATTVSLLNDGRTNGCLFYLPLEGYAEGLCESHFACEIRGTILII